MKYLVIGILLIVAFLAGGVIGNRLKLDKITPVKPDTINQPVREDNNVQNLTRKLDEVSASRESLSWELSNLKASYEQAKIGYENCISAEKTARLKAEQELNAVKQTITSTALSNPETKPKKPNPMAQMIKSQIQKELKKKMQKLNQRALLSLYQQDELNKSIDALAEKMVELFPNFFAGETFSEESAKEMGELMAQQEQKFQDILTPDQYSVYKEIVEEDRKEKIDQTIKIYMDGTMGMKGISESLSLSDEQKQKVQGMLEEKFNSKKPETSRIEVNNSGLPFDDKEFVEKVKGVLTPEQYPKFDEYLKEQEEIAKMAKEFIPKKTGENNQK